MSQMMNHIEYLSKEIGPRPAGTEEEQQAALYITEQFQKDGGFVATMEEFSSSSNTEAGLAILAGVTVVATVLAIIFPVLAIPAFILATAAAVVYVLESFDRPILSRVLSRGASQNVVAKYQPGAEGAEQPSPRGHLRKVILVAHYDTGRVTPSIVSRIDSMGLPIPLICVIGMVAAAFFQLIRIFIVGGGGMGLLILNILSILAVVVCLLPVVKALLVRSAPYNEGAINNATGTAALLEVASRIARGSVSEAELAEDADGVIIHGEAAARAAGLIPEGAQIRYDAEQLAPPAEFGDYSEQERILSAKAAIAALTGKPVERRVYGSVAENLVNSHADEIPADALLDEVMAPITEPSPSVDRATSVTGASAHDFSSVPNVTTATPSAAGTSGSAEGFENAPSWFVAAQQNARKSERYNADEGPQIKRSRYTEAIENAERGLAHREEELRAIQQARREEAARRALEVEADKAREDAPLEGDAVMQQPVDEANFEAQPQLASVTAGELDDMSATISPLDIEPIESMPVPETGASDVALADTSTDAPVEKVVDDRLAGIPSLDNVQTSEGEARTHERIAKLPSIDPANPYNPAPTSNPSRSGIMRKLRTNIPSLSGLIAPVPSEPESTRPAANVAAAPAASNTDSQSRANAASFDPVEVPRSRSGNLLQRLRKNGEEELSDTPQQWLNVDDDFEARSVGRARGSWESFRDDQGSDTATESTAAQPVSTDEGLSRQRWQGGAFSRLQLGHVDTLSGEGAEADQPLPQTLAEADPEPALTGEIEQIYHFRNPQFNHEVWFVAMGSDGVSHDGARAFIEEHRDELRGAMIIEIESLGTGTLSVASEEGRVRKIASSSRVKRYTRTATAATGISVDSVSLAGSDSIASTLQKAGFQTMHLFGAEDGKPALKGSPDDVLENVDEHVLNEHVGFVFELLKG